METMAGFDADPARKLRRVLMTGDASGEPWQMIVELARALRDAGVEVHLATMGQPLSAGDHRRLAASPGIRLHESSFKLDWMAEPWRDIVRAGEWLLRLEDRVGPEVVHLNHPVYGALPWRNPAVAAVHGCLLSRWLAVKGEAAPAGWDPYRRAMASGLRGARAVAAPSQSLLRGLGLFYGSFAPGRVIPYGRDPAEFPPGPKQPVVLCIAGLHDEAVDVAGLHEVAPDLSWPVYVAGETSLPAGGRLPAGGAMFLGWLSPEERRSWLSRASLFVLPAVYEPFGIPVLDAAWSGCALVLGDIPSLSEVWGDAAVYAAPGDRHALRHAVRRLIQNAPLRRRLGERARERAREFTLRRMVDGYLDLYREVLAQFRPQPGGQVGAPAP